MPIFDTFGPLVYFFCTSDQQKKHKLCRGPSNKHSYQVGSHLTQWFQRRRLECKKLTDNDPSDK
jgi:hypothetical protein